MSNHAKLRAGVGAAISFLRHQVLAPVDSLALPPHCEVCGRAMEDRRSPICHECFKSVVLVGDDYCRRCGAKQGRFVGIINTCLSCESELLGFGTTQVVAAGPHEGLLRDAILSLKFGGRRSVAKVLGYWLAQVVVDRGVEVDVIVPVPLSFNREWKRGFNQSAEIGSVLSEVLKKPIVNNAIKRSRNTRPQTHLEESARRNNLKKAFVLGKGKTAVGGKHVLLVDDVMTTGTTIREVVKALKKAKAKSVTAAVAARTGK